MLLRTRCYQFDREDGEVVHRDQDALDADVGAVGKEIDAVVVDGDDDDKQQCLRRATAAVGVGIAAGDVHAGGDVDYGHDADADVVEDGDDPGRHDGNAVEHTEKGWESRAHRKMDQ